MNVPAIARDIARLAKHLPFEKVEEEIERLPLDGEAKAALWLYAWSMQGREQREETLAAVLAAGGMTPG